MKPWRRQIRVTNLISQFPLNSPSRFIESLPIAQTFVALEKLKFSTLKKVGKKLCVDMSFFLGIPSK